MPATKMIAGVVGALGLTGCLVSVATVSVATAARADECSGLMCVFQSRPAQPQPAPAPAVAPQTVQSAEPAAVDDAAPKAKPKAKLRPVPVVTIAAGPTEIARLKALAAVMQKPRVKIVEAKGDAAAADFTVAIGQDGTKLFTEQMHVVAGPKVATLADLQGKVVSFGPEHSAEAVAARKAFAAQGIKVAETPLELDNALDGLATGDLDAVVVLAPQPDARLKKVTGGGLHLVAWPQAATPPDGTVVAAIDGDAYPGLAKAGDKIAALGVDAVLTAGPKAKTQPAAKAFLGALAQHSAALSKRGFDLIRADLAARQGRRVANADAR